MSEKKQLVIKNVKLAFRNFAGRPTKYNREGGKRTFCVIVEQDVGESLSRDGWNVKWFKVREGEENEPRRGFMEVVVNYRSLRGPQIIMHIEDENIRPKYITEKELHILDHAEIAFCDMILNPYRWTDDDGNVRLKPYLQKMHVTIRQDELDKRYRQDYEDQSALDNGD